MSCTGVTQELIDQMDLILTTVNLKEFDSPKIRRINLFLDKTDLDVIHNVLEEPFKRKEINYQDIFRRELFFDDMDFENKDDVLKYMTEIMLKKGYISESVRRSIFKREEMATTELGSLVAIPHALLNDMEEAVVSVMILKKPIQWVNEKVQVVLLLNIPKSKYDIWEIVFKRLYQYLIGEQGVARLIKTEVITNL
jgi:lichenan operon transcriptional antiterminator